VQEETSAPHARLACIHLHSSFKKIIGRRKQSNSHVTRRKEQIDLSPEEFTPSSAIDRRST
jgi:hypothetical protein